MTAFHHLQVGTVEQEWAARGLDDLPRLVDPGAGARVLVVAAHPDDETLGAGALIAEAAARGADVRVVIATDGEGSHPDSPTHPRDRLAALRRDEVRTALHRLHPSVEPVFLGLPDGALAEHADDLDALLAPHVAGRTHLVTPWAGDRHPDHAACAESAARLRPDDAHHWQYPIWAWHWDDPQQPVLPWAWLRRTTPGPDALAAKASALAAHVSQHQDLSPAPGDEAILPANVLAHFRRDAEQFVIDAPAGDPAYFDRLYASDADPWQLADRFYEQRKRAVFLASLPRPRFRRAFEPGCSTGLLTVELAARCDQVEAWDAAASAVERARERVVGSGSVDVRRGAIPDEWPTGEFDLVALSEVAYYCPDLDVLAERVRGTLSADGVLATVNWRHEAVHHPHTAESVHAALGCGLVSIARHEEEDFLLEVWSRDGVSVARADGVLG